MKVCVEVRAFLARLGRLFVDPDSRDPRRRPAFAVPVLTAGGLVLACMPCFKPGAPVWYLVVAVLIGLCVLSLNVWNIRRVVRNRRSRKAGPSS